MMLVARVVLVILFGFPRILFSCGLRFVCSEGLVFNVWRLSRESLGEKGARYPMAGSRWGQKKLLVKKVFERNHRYLQHFRGSISLRFLQDFG